MEYLREIVEQIFNRWMALKIVVEHGVGGRDSHKTAIQIMDYMYEYCKTNAPDLCESEIKETLDEIMDQEYDTLCDDNSIDEISGLLMKFVKMCRENNVAEIQTELSKLPPCTMWLKPEFKVQLNPNAIGIPSDDEDDDDDDEDDEEPMDLDGEGTSFQSQNNESSEDDEPGWTKVRTSKRKH